MISKSPTEAQYKENYISFYKENFLKGIYYHRGASFSAVAFYKSANFYDSASHGEARVDFREDEIFLYEITKEVYNLNMARDGKKESGEYIVVIHLHPFPLLWFPSQLSPQQI